MYQITITQQIILSKQEYERMYEILEKGNNIVLVYDVDGNKHLYDWKFVVHSDVEILKPVNLPEISEKD